MTSTVRPVYDLVDLACRIRIHEEAQCAPWPLVKDRKTVMLISEGKPMHTDPIYDLSTDDLLV